MNREGPLLLMADAAHPRGTPEDDRAVPCFDIDEATWPPHVLSVRGAAIGSRWRTTVPVRLAQPRHLRDRLVTLAPPCEGEPPDQTWLDIATRLTLVAARDDHDDPEIVAFADDDPAAFWLRFGFWAYRCYRIDSGPSAAMTVTLKVRGDDNLPRSSAVAHATLVPDDTEVRSSP